MLIVPVLYIPLVYLSSSKADLPISPPGNTLTPSYSLSDLKSSCLFLKVAANKFLGTPLLKTVTIPKLPVPAKFISPVFSAFIKTLISNGAAFHTFGSQ